MLNLFHTSKRMQIVRTELYLKAVQKFLAILASSHQTCFSEENKMIKSHGMTQKIRCYSNFIKYTYKIEIQRN